MIICVTLNICLQKYFTRTYIHKQPQTYTQHNTYTHTHNQTQTDLLLDKAGVDDIDDAVDGETGLCDVGGYDDLPGAGRCRVEDSGLHF